MHILACPSAKPVLANSAFYQPVKINANLVSTSYNFWVGTGNYPVVISNAWYGWQGFAQGSTTASPSSPCPRLSAAGTRLVWPENNLAKFLAQPSDQPMMLDLNNPDTGVSGTTAVKYLNNHEGGQNTVFTDGHGKWLRNDEITKQYRNIFY